MFSASHHVLATQLRFFFQNILLCYQWEFAALPRMVGVGIEKCFFFNNEVRINAKLKKNPTLFFV